MAATADFPAEFLSLEADFVDSKIAINNSIGDILRGRGRRFHLVVYIRQVSKKPRLIQWYGFFVRLFVATT